MQKRNPKAKTTDRVDKAPGSKAGFNSVLRAIDTLVCLSQGINNVTEIAEHCKLSKATVHRLLKTLEIPNVTVYDSLHHRYYLGPLISQLIANPATTHELLITFAQDEMKHLFEISEETITLDVMVGIQHILLYEIPSKHSLKVTEDSTSTRPMLAVGATSKVLISQLEDEELDLVVKFIRERTLIEISNTDRDLLITELKRIRQQGYAFTHGERIAGTVGIAAPIKNYLLPTSLGILGPDYRLLPKVSNIIEEMKAGAERISNNLKKIITLP